MLVRPQQHDYDHVIVSRSFKGLEVGVYNMLIKCLIIFVCWCGHECRPSSTMHNNTPCSIKQINVFL
jgi:hypothetical protein